VKIRLPTSFVSDRHAYTRSRVPWRIDETKDDGALTAEGRKNGWRLFHYLSGGGLRAFGRSVQQEEADVKRTRFLVTAGVLGLIWLVFLIA
jgi:hypothetical protein